MSTSITKYEQTLHAEIEDSNLERARQKVGARTEVDDVLDEMFAEWWDRDAAIALCTRFELQQRGVPEPRRWHVALAGGVLYAGMSNKDLDLVFYPHDGSKLSKMGLRSLYRSLRELGWVREATAAKMAKGWRAKGSTDDKHVEKWRTSDGRRVDVIVPSLRVRA